MEKAPAKKIVLIIGSGPAGLAAAIFAQRAGAHVTLVERNAQCGAKLLATGGGHCNATNLRPLTEWPTLFGKRGRFITPALKFLPREALENWFAQLGDPLTTQDAFHLFPKSRSAKNVRDALQNEAESLGVKIRKAARCTGIIVENGTATGAIFENGAAETQADAVILAAGGNSYPATGSDWTGCRIAEKLGHTVTPPTQGLVGLRTESVPADLAGVILPNARVSFKTKGKKEEFAIGELLITHTGISGPAVLDISAAVCQTIAATKAPAMVHIRWNADLDADKWRAMLEDFRTKRGKTPVAAILHNRFPQRLAQWFCYQAGVPQDTAAAALKAEPRDKLLTLLAGFPAQITDGEGWNKAMITRGGVEPKEINPETLGSKLVRNLHFAGEMIDVDGPCGGYNLHWAFACGALAGAKAAEAAAIAPASPPPRTTPDSRE